MDLTEMAKLGRVRRRLNLQLEENRRVLAPLVIAAIKAGVPQVDIVRESGYTREQVRRLCRAAGIAAG